MIDHHDLYFLALRGTNINFVNLGTKGQIALNTIKHCLVSNDKSIFLGLESSAKVT